MLVKTIERLNLSLQQLLFEVAYGRKALSMSMSSSTLVQKFNPLTGSNEWHMEKDDFDYQQQLARAAFADMLHDKQRNRLYHEGLRMAVGSLRRRGEEVRVLDIGTGTGLLAIMAAKLGAESVTAVEEFGPMAKVAREVISKNGLSNRIELVEKRSTDLVLGLDMKQRANVLVTEVFDTELIGEGAIATFNHAHRHLLTEDCITVPTSATVFVQLVSSPLASTWDRLQTVDTANLKIQVGRRDETRCSPLMLHDIQLEQFSDFVELSQPVPVFRFDFSGRSGPLDKKRQHCVEVECTTEGCVQAILFWWQLEMEPTSTLVLSCQPQWSHGRRSCKDEEAESETVWRDHWMQSVYFPLSCNTTDLMVHANEKVCIIAQHDEYSFLFDVVEVNAPNNGSRLQIPNSPYLPLTRTRVAELNDGDRNAKIASSLRNFLTNRDAASINALFIGEASLMPLMALTLGINRVFLTEDNKVVQSTLETLAEENSLQPEQRLCFIDQVDQVPKDVKIDLVFGEPHFTLSVLPWHHLLFWHHLSRLRNEKTVGQSTHFIPQNAHLWALPVHFDHLWKIRAPVGSTEGIQLTPFDKVIMKAIEESDDRVEPQPLWEYPCVALTEAAKLCTFDLSKDAWQTQFSVEMTFDLNEHSQLPKPNGVALWMDWQLDGSNVISDGPISKVTVGRRVKWYKHNRQGVYFLPSCNEETRTAREMNAKLTYNGQEGELKLDFQLL